MLQTQILDIECFLFVLSAVWLGALGHTGWAIVSFALGVMLAVHSAP